MATTTATGVREVPQSRREVWRALAVLEPYCSVCDVSYILGEDAGPPRAGTTFVCAPGRLDGPPAAGAPQGEIVETWTTRIELEETDAGGTRVTMTITHEPTGGGRVVRRLQRGALRRLVQRTVDAELAKVPAHVERAARPA